MLTERVDRRQIPGFRRRSHSVVSWCIFIATLPRAGGSGRVAPQRRNASVTAFTRGIEGTELTMMALLAPGIELLLIGLGSVFAFLVLLIAIITAVSAGARRLAAPEPAPPVNDPQVQARHTAAIAAAVHRFRQLR